MHCSINAKIKGQSTKNKALIASWTHKKTQSNVEIAFEKKERTNHDFINDLTSDIKLLKLESKPLESITLIVEDCSSLGKIFNRSVAAFAKIGVHFDEMEWAATEGLIEIRVKDGIGSDVPPLVETLVRMVMRATAKFSNTQHPLSLYDLKQTTSLIKDQADELEGVGTVMDWFSTRELIVAEEAKAAKAEAKAKAKADKPKTKGSKTNGSKAKAGGKKGKDPKEAKTEAADLTPEAEAGDSDPNGE